MFGLELLLIPLGNAIIGGLGALGFGGALVGANALAVGTGVAATGAGAAIAGLANAGSAANPMIAGGYQAAVTDAYNNAVTGSSDFVNGLGLPFAPALQTN